MNNTSGPAIGVDLGGTNIRAALVDINGVVRRKQKTRCSGDFLNNLFGLLEELYESGLKGIGLAIAGTVDKERGTITSSPNIPGIEGIDIVRILKDKFGVPVYLDNDAALAALGESFAGAGKGLKSFVMLTLGTGIGCGVIYDNSLLDIAAELGHMTVEPDGRSCPCGGKGCLEAYAGARAISNSVLKEITSGTVTSLSRDWKGEGSSITPKEIFKQALEGDALALGELKNAGRYLGIGIANAVNIFSPEAVILTGGLTGAWDIYVKEAIEEASGRAFKGLFDKTRIMASALGDDAGLTGAACMSFVNGE